MPLAAPVMTATDAPVTPTPRLGTPRQQSRPPTRPSTPVMISTPQFRYQSA